MPRRPGEEILSKRRRYKKQSYDKEYNEHRPAIHKFYNTSRWRSLREYMMRKQPLCQECLKHGIIKKGDLVDHIKPIREGGSPVSIKNLQVLCHECHNKKHADERKGHCNNT